MKKGKLIFCLGAVVSMVTGCAFDESVPGEWGQGGIALLPLLWSPTEEGDCNSIIKGWIESCKEHGINISGYDNSDVQQAMNSQNWTIEYDSEDNEYYEKVGILSNSLGSGTSGLSSLAQQCLSDISLHEPEYIVVPCFASEIYSYTGLQADYPEIKIGAYSVWYGDSTMSSLGKNEIFKYTTGQSTCYNLPMLHMLINAIDGEFTYEDKISEDNIRNYYYQPWTSTDSETFKAMETLSLDAEHPSITKAMLDEVVPSKANGKTFTDFQNFLTDATFDYLSSDEVRAKEDNAKVTRSEPLKIGLIGLNATSMSPQANADFLQEYAKENYDVDITYYKNDGTGVSTIVSRAMNDGCKGIMINATDADIITAAIDACQNDVYVAISNSIVYESKKSLLINADSSGDISKYFVGAYGVDLANQEAISKSILDGMFEDVKK